jgi:hydrogenase-4 membrane subunit HyfE
MGWITIYYILFAAIITVSVFVANIIMTAINPGKGPIYLVIYIGFLILSLIYIPTISDSPDTTGIRVFGFFHQSKDASTIYSMAMIYFASITIISTILGVIRLFPKSGK